MPGASWVGWSERCLLGNNSGTALYDQEGSLSHPRGKPAGSRSVCGRLSSVTLPRGQRRAWNTVGGGQGAERRQVDVTQGRTVLIHCVLWDLVESFKWGVMRFKDHSDLCSGNSSPAVAEKADCRGVCESGRPRLCCINK